MTGSVGGVVQVWEAGTGLVVQRFKDFRRLCASGAEGPAVAFSPKGGQMLAGKHGVIEAHNVEKPDSLLSLLGEDTPACALAFSSDGRWLASGAVDGALSLWDAANGKYRALLGKHESFVHDVAFSPDGQQIASASEDATIRLWDAVTGRQTHRLREHTGRVRLLCYSPDSRRIAGASDHVIRVWDAQTGAQLHVLVPPESMVHELAFSQDGTQIIAKWSSDRMQIWDAKTGGTVQRLEGFTDIHFVAGHLRKPRFCAVKRGLGAYLEDTDDSAGFFLTSIVDVKTKQWAAHFPLSLEHLVECLDGHKLAGTDGTYLAIISVEDA